MRLDPASPDMTRMLLHAGTLFAVIADF